MGQTFKILSLDGGGGKGLYTLGILNEIEKVVGQPLNKTFDMFYGTSTGSIIAASLARGESVQTIIDYYIDCLPKIMSKFSARSRSNALRDSLSAYFENDMFDSIPVRLGLVATNLEEKKPLIFKSFSAQAHGMKDSFVPGFGVTIADAVEASCSANPFFRPKLLTPKNSPPLTAVDGGFVANNPSLFALVDARESLKVPDEDIRILSLGTGNYPEKYPFTAWPQGIWLKPTLKLISMQFAANSNTIEIVFKLLTKKIRSVRVADTFSEPELATSLFEHRKDVLNRLMSKGRWSYGNFEPSIKELLV